METKKLNSEEIFGIRIIKLLRGFYNKKISISALKIVVDKTKDSKTIALFHNDIDKSEEQLFDDIKDFFCLLKKEKISLELLETILKEYKVPIINVKDSTRKEKLSYYTHFQKELLDENKFFFQDTSFGKFEVRLEPRFIISDDFVQQMEKEGFLISDLDQFIEFGKSFPDSYKKFNIVTFDGKYTYKLWSVYDYDKRITYSKDKENNSKTFVLFCKKIE